MTDTSPKRLRKLADEALCNTAFVPKGLLYALAAEKEAQAEVDEMDVVASEFAHRLAMHLECLILECPSSCYFWNESMETLGAYRSAMNAIHERLSPTHMGEPVVSEKEAQHQSEQPLAMVAEVPLPETDNACMYCYTIDHLREYGQACAQAARDAAFDEGIELVRDCHCWQHTNNQEYPNWWHEGVDAAISQLQAAKKGTT
jgi:hypothetical protein